jgi:epoxyqueuosine reductase
MSIPPAARVDLSDRRLERLGTAIRSHGQTLGFQQIGITGIDLSDDERRLERWLEQQRHGEMSYMARHGVKRSRPDLLVPGTTRVISVRLDYWPGDAADADAVLQDPNRAYISRYTLGRDYHKVLRRRLRRLARYIEEQIGPFGYRVFVDSAPVLEKSLARNAGLGWVGKHTNLLHHKAGSYFFLGELFTDLPLPIDEPATDHCGSCRACIDICPTQAIVAPYELDARRCISYLTIELRGRIPVEFRKAIGNRIFGCDDCQLVCPWNKFARSSAEEDFKPRHKLDDAALVDLFRWTEAEWATATEGSALRRAGYEGWLRNLAVALGNAPTDPTVVQVLRDRLNYPSEVVREHVEWALSEHTDC